MLVPSIFEENAITNLFNDVFNDVFDDGFNNHAFNDVEVFSNELDRQFSSMNTNVKELSNAYQMDIELPGFNKEDIHADLKDGYLTIEATTNRDESSQDANGRVIRRERRYGSCQRSIYVGETMRKEDIKASFEQGILTVVIPKMGQQAVEQKQYIPIS